MAGLISLQSNCVLTILSEIHCFTADMLSLLPPKLRSRILLHLPAVDLYRLGQTEDHKDNLWRDLWIGLPFTSEDVWKIRFETTLKKYTNVSCLEEDVSRCISWLDRYLVSCLLNVPLYYQTLSSQPSLGAAFYVTSDVSLNDVGIVKAKTDSSRCGLVALKTRAKSALSSHFISNFYRKKLELNPFNLPIGTELTTYDRIRVMLDVFPDWTPSVLPLEIDEHLSQSDYNTSLCVTFLSKVKTLYLLSKYLRLCPYAEVENPDTVSSSGIGHFCKYIVGLLNGYKSIACDKLILLPPAMKKEVTYKDMDDDGDEVSSFSFTPISLSPNELLEWFFKRFPNINQLSVSMHDAYQDCWKSSVYREAKLQSLQLKVTRPTFKHITVPLLPFSLISDVSLQGLSISEEDFHAILLAVLKSPVEQKLSFANLCIQELNDVPVMHSLVMEKACQYKTSLNIHRIKGVNAIQSVLSLYREIWLNDLSFYLLEDTFPFPISTAINCKSVHVNRVTLHQNDSQFLLPLFSRAESVYLSLGNCSLHNATFAIPMLCTCVQLCEENLRYLDCKNTVTYSNLKPEHVNHFFSTVFSLPKCVLENLVFDPSRLIQCYASTALHRTTNYLMQLQQGVQLTKQQAELDELKHQVSCWRTMCEVWCQSSNGVKIKCLNGLSGIVFDELEDELGEICQEYRVNYNNN